MEIEGKIDGKGNNLEQKFALKEERELGNNRLC
jgi:hypothetical protein